MEAKNNIFTSDTDTVKGKTYSNIRGYSYRSKRQRKVTRSRPGPKLNQRIGVYTNSSSWIKMLIIVVVKVVYSCCQSLLKV